MSNKEFRTAEVFESNETMFFTSIFCGSAVHILKDLIVEVKSAVCVEFLPAEGKAVGLSHYSRIEQFISVEQKITLT